MNKVIKCRQANTFIGGNNTTTTIPSLIGNFVTSSSTINSNNIANNENSPDFEILYENQPRNIPLTTAPSIYSDQYIRNQPSINNNVPPSPTFSSNNNRPINNNEQLPEYSVSDPLRNIPPSTLNNQFSISSVNTHYSSHSTIDNHSSISPTINNHSSISPTINNHSSISPTINTHSSISPTINTHSSISSTINTKPYNTDNKISENNYIIKNNKDNIIILKDIKNKFSTNSGHSSIPLNISKFYINNNNDDDIRTSSTHKLLDRNTSNLNTIVSNSSTIEEKIPSDTI